MNERINTLWESRRMEYCAATKRKELLTYAANLKIITPSERSQGDRATYYMVPHGKFQKTQTNLRQRKAVQWLLGNRGSREGQEDPRRRRMWSLLIEVKVPQVYTCQNLYLYTLSMCTLLQRKYVNKGLGEIIIITSQTRTTVW